MPLPHDIRRGYKILTEDFRSPIQGGQPLWDGATLPWTLPMVSLDSSDREYAAGWNYCASLAEAIPIAGLWPGGRPSIMVEVEAGGDAIQRGTHRRSSLLTLVRQCDEAEIYDGLTQFSRIFAPYTAEMAAEQWAWRRALARPRHDEPTVVAGLQRALETRGLAAWTLQRFETGAAARDALAARDAVAWIAWAADAAQDTWIAWAKRGAGTIRGAWDAGAIRGAGATGDIGGTWAAWAAGDALAVYFASAHQWIGRDRDHLTVGIRDAYASGLGIALPVGDTVLGWAMERGDA